MLFSGLLAAVGAGGAASAAGAGATAGAAAATGATAAATTGAVAGGAGGIGTALGALGTGVQVVGQFKAQAAAKRAEALREQQMKLDATRQIIREGIVARANAVSNATNQGAQGGSGLQGGIAQITSRANQGLVGVAQNEAIGSAMFDANADIASGQTLSSIGSGIGSLGSALVDNQQTIGKLGTYYSQRPYI